VPLVRNPWFLRNTSAGKVGNKHNEEISRRHLALTIESSLATASEKRNSNAISLVKKTSYKFGYEPTLLNKSVGLWCPVIFRVWHQKEGPRFRLDLRRHNLIQHHPGYKSTAT
jgi:hypothetical protein